MRVTVEFDDDEESTAKAVIGDAAAFIGTGIEDNRVYSHRMSVSNIYHVYVDKMKEKMIPT